MVKKLMGGVLLALFLIVTSVPASAAKPPDLPVEVEQEFDPQEPVAPESTERIQAFEFYSGLLPICPGEGQHLVPQRCPVPACTHGQCPASVPPRCIVETDGPVRCCPAEHDDFCGRLIRHLWRGLAQVFDGSLDFDFEPCAPMELMYFELPCQQIRTQPALHLVPGGDCFTPLTTVANVGVTLPQPIGAPVPCVSGRPVQLVVPPAMPMDAGVLGDSVESLQQLAESRKLYELAEFHLKAGQLMTAYHYYQETHIHSPLSRHGQVALSKLVQIEAQLIKARAGIKHDGADNGCDFQVCEPVSEREPTDNERYLHKLAQAQDMFHIAERCRTGGDLDKAYTCYHEVRRLCPDSDYALRAAQYIRRLAVLRELDRTASESEECEDSDGENSGNETVPLELEELLPLFLPFIPELFGLSPWLPVERCFVPFLDLGTSTQDAGAHDERGDCTCCRRNHGELRVASKLARPQGTDAEECSTDGTVRSPELIAWILQTALGGSGTHVELEVNTASPNGLRVHGGLFFGVIGCQVICEGDSIRVVRPALRGMR